MRIRDVVEHLPRDECAAFYSGMHGAQELKPARTFIDAFIDAIRSIYFQGIRQCLRSSAARSPTTTS
ncbi:hypothetical protein BSU04_22200 [Caballeronia sordidicola]|uniref:Uncharacterized protein n=1 Tax=Caballeronia sordidicola TaxID=196367 RepID=A0A226WYV1_CABSO|nr:hypothetical protein BSU04_22200 [Caballeronia sordidicola]